MNSVDCYVMRSATPGWDAGTYWPDSAKAILDSGAPSKGGDK